MRPVGAQGHNYETVNATGCRFDPERIDSRNGDEAQCGVEFRHSTRNASRIRWKVRSGVS